MSSKIYNICNDENVFQSAILDFNKKDSIKIISKIVLPYILTIGGLISCIFAKHFSVQVLSFSVAVSALPLNSILFKKRKKQKQ